MQLTRPLHEDSPQWEWFQRAVVATIKKNGKVDYDTKIRLTSTVLKDSAKKSEHMDKIEAAFKKYSYVNNKFYRGLEKRRTKEAALFRNGTYPTTLD